MNLDTDDTLTGDAFANLDTPPAGIHPTQPTLDYPDSAPLRLDIPDTNAADEILHNHPSLTPHHHSWRAALTAAAAIIAAPATLILILAVLNPTTTLGDHNPTTPPTCGPETSPSMSWCTPPRTP